MWPELDCIWYNIGNDRLRANRKGENAMAEAEGLIRRIQAAGGQRKAGLVLKHANVVNVFTESIETADIAIEDGMVVGVGAYEGEVEADLSGKYICPGFLDGHIHLESSMVTPWEFQGLVLPHGTTCVITDPHEIANVAGAEGIRYMLEETEGLKLDVCFMLPSCVPSTGLDESGARLGPEELDEFYREPRVLGLAEVMDAFGVVGCKEAVLQKMEGALRRGRLIDGHAPLLTGKALNAYVAAGVRSDHECSRAEEAMEKMARGQWVMVREGTAAKNLEGLLPIFEPPYYNRAMLVTDDKHPGDLLRMGHIDAMMRMAVGQGADPIRAIKMGTWNTASCFGLKGKGAVAPGYEADLVVLEDLEGFRVRQVYKAGRLVAEDGRCLPEAVGLRPLDVKGSGFGRVFHSFHMKGIVEKDLEVPTCGKRQRVIDLVPHELMTRERVVEWREMPGVALGVDIERDIVKLAVLERHHATGHVGLGFLGNYGLKKGAVATSIGHDSHNLIIAGTNDADMVLAGNQVIQNEGGLAVALDGRLVGELPLPIAGLMSTLPAREVDGRLESLKLSLKEMGISEDIDGFMTLAFVSLPVIPDLRLNTYGIVDVNRQEVVGPFFS